MRIYLRQGNITFSRDFVEHLKNKGIILTRRNHFKRSGIIINHGNTKPITKANNVKDLYLINKPEAISLCSDKMKNYKILNQFYPKTCRAVVDVKKFPVLAKPINGHHGYGIKKFDYIEDLSKFMKGVNKPYIIQEYIPIKHEYRFNILDRDVFQVSHKERLDEFTDKGGYVFSYRSLGKDAKLSKKFKDFVKDVIKAFHEVVGYTLGDYCIDVIKGQDNKYYLSEINSAYGVGQFTVDKLLETLNDKYRNGELEQYRVR